MTWAPLAETLDEQIFGGKAVSLGAALRAGLRVPPGFTLASALVEAVARANPHGLAEAFAGRALFLLQSRVITGLGMG